MQLLRKISKRIERAFDWLGLVHEDDVADDSLLSYPTEPKPDPIGAIFEKLRERDGCPHWRSNAVDDAPIGPDKVYHCPNCGLDYREVTDSLKPWLVVDYAPVEVAS